MYTRRRGAGDQRDPDRARAPQSRARTRTTAAVVDGCPEAESVRHWAEKMVLPYIRGARSRSGCLRGPRNKTGATRDSTQAHSHPPPQSVYNDSCDKEEASGRLAASMPVVNKPDLSDMSRYVAVYFEAFLKHACNICSLCLVYITDTLSADIIRRKTDRAVMKTRPTRNISRRSCNYTLNTITDIKAHTQYWCTGVLLALKEKKRNIRDGLNVLVILRKL